MTCTPNDLYSKTEYSKGTLDSLVDYTDRSLLEEVDFETSVSTFSLYNSPPERVEIRLVRDHNFDSKCVWVLGTVWFDSLPVMVFQRAGRYGESHRERFITDTPRFVEMCKYLTAFLYDLKITEKALKLTSINQDEPRSDLDNFDSYSLDGHFDYYY